MSIEAMTDAATAARLHSRTDGRKTIVISLTEEGFVVAGQSGLDGLGMKWQASRIVPFVEFRAYEPALTAAVHRVSRDLDRSEGVR